MTLKRSIRITIFIIIALFIIFGGVIVQGKVIAANSPAREKIYTSVRLNYGDSLWSIASHYCGDGSQDKITEYVEDLKQMNGIVNERSLKAGNYLTVYYWQ